VITNEHVVAMMKAAISETEDIPLFVSKKLFPLFRARGNLQQSSFLVCDVVRRAWVVLSCTSCYQICHLDEACSVCVWV